MIKTCGKFILGVLLAGGIIFCLGGGERAARLLRRFRPVRPVILTLSSYPVSEQELVYLKKVNPYGIILFEYSFQRGVRPDWLKHDLRRELGRNDLLFFVDQEGGEVNRLKGLYPGTVYPSARSFGELAQKGLAQAEEAAYQAGLTAGADGSAAGFDVNFAPAAELCAAKGFLKTRCFSADPETGAVLAAAYARGIKEGGMEPAYKHAPGLAYSRKDPHSGRAVVHRSLEELRAEELRFFKDASRYDYLLTAHAVYPAIDPDSVSVYSPLFYRFLRNELQFKGWIVTDALNMASAMPGEMSRGEQMQAALAAGADLVMPFFGPQEDFEERWREIQKIKPAQIRAFNKRLRAWRRGR